jgi:hypothetical protein
VLQSSVQGGKNQLPDPHSEAESFHFGLLQMHKFSATGADLP